MVARSFELSSNSNLSEGAAIPEGMARLDVKTSNALFDELSNWNYVLKQSHIDLEELSDE